jgi:hypothetical protein
MNICPKMSMMRFYSTNFLALLLFLFCNDGSAGNNTSSQLLSLMDIITTDSIVMHDLQNLSQEISTKNAIQVQVSLVNEKKVARYLQLGNKGDVIVTSYKNLCLDLASQGLASSFESAKILKKDIYCIGLSSPQRVMILLPEEYPSSTQEAIYDIAKRINAKMHIVGKYENVYQSVMKYVQSQTAVCSFRSTFANLNIEDVTLQKIDEGIQYYACPLIGLHKNTYKVLMKHYEAQHNS